MNARLVKVDLEQILAGLPEPEPFDISGFPAAFDAVIAVAGFEERATALAGIMESGHPAADHLLLLEYDTNVDENLPTRRRWLTCHEWSSTRVVAVSNAIAEPLARMLEESQGVPRVLVDLSGASNLVVVKLVQALLELDMSVKPTFFYAEAEVYYPTQNEFDDLEVIANEGLSTGVGEIDLSFARSGLAVDGLEPFLIAIPGWGRDRIRAIASELSPDIVDSILDRSPSSRIAWIVGVPRLGENHWRVEALMRIHGLDHQARIHRVGTFDYKATILRLESLYQELRNSHNLTLAPLGSKFQAFGCAIFCNVRPAVRAVLATPQRYRAESYSRGVGATWQLRFPATRGLGERMQSLDTLERQGERPGSERTN